MFWRFRVSMELIKPEKPDPATSFKGLDYIDVPGLSKKEYKVQFYAHKEGTFSSKVSKVICTLCQNVFSVWLWNMNCETVYFKIYLLREYAELERLHLTCKKGYGRCFLLNIAKHFRAALSKQNFERLLQKYRIALSQL